MMLREQLGNAFTSIGMKRIYFLTDGISILRVYGEIRRSHARRFEKLLLSLYFA